jgi:hypothetical protein
MKYPCKECIVKTLCGERCDKLNCDNKLNLLNFMYFNKCCPDCGGKDGYVFYEWEFILCRICNSLFNSSSSICPRTIIRWNSFKYIIDKDSPGHFVMDFDQFALKIKELNKMKGGAFIK